MDIVEKTSITDEILAREVSFDEYMEKYAEQFTEWVEGTVIKLSPVTEIHDGLFRFFLRLLEVFLTEMPIGIIRVAPFVMKTAPYLPGREPDLQITLNEHADIVKPTKTEGAADVVIEIVSKESSARDRGDKLNEYEAGGVREYWLIDPRRREPLFYRRDDAGFFIPIPLPDGIFRSIVLPKFRLDTRLLWQTPLPDVKQVIALVEAMLKEEA